MKDKAIAYFKAFSSKDLDSLNNMYAEDIVLTDWSSSFRGRESVLQSNKDFFEETSVVKITYEPCLMYVGTNTIACEIAITIVGDVTSSPETLLGVVDIIEFNEE